MKVQEYRDLCSGVRQALTSVKSAVGQGEQTREIGWLRRAAAELAGATCPRASERDVERAEGLLEEAMPYLNRAGLPAPAMPPEGPTAT